MAQEEKQEATAKGSDKQTYIQLSTSYGLKTNISQMAQVGLGTWKSKPGEVTKAVSYAIDVGYHHIDCAHVYGNEAEVGAAIESDTRVITRENLFVTSKLWNTKHTPEDVVPALKTTLKNLKLDYLDLYLIHWPTSMKRGDDLFPKKEDGTIDYGNIVDIVDTWKAMEECVRLGLARHIGLSNFNHEQIDKILSNCSIKPAVLQVESHPYLTQKPLLQYCKDKGIAFTAYSPLGSPDRPWAKKEDPTLLEDKTLIDIAEKKGCTVAQLLIRFQVERGCLVIPKSVTPKRIKANLEVWEIKLNDKEMEEIEKFDRNWRACLPAITLPNGQQAPRDASHPYYPFKAKY